MRAPSSSPAISASIFQFLNSPPTDMLTTGRGIATSVPAGVPVTLASPVAPVQLPLRRQHCTAAGGGCKYVNAVRCSLEVCDLHDTYRDFIFGKIACCDRRLPTLKPCWLCILSSRGIPSCRCGDEFRIGGRVKHYTDDGVFFKTNNQTPALLSLLTANFSARLDCDRARLLRFELDVRHSYYYFPAMMVWHSSRPTCINLEASDRNGLVGRESVR